jgi:hypothetical protein
MSFAVRGDALLDKCNRTVAHGSTGRQNTQSYRSQPG